jgi:hypothetical protein
VGHGLEEAVPHSDRTCFPQWGPRNPSSSNTRLGRKRLPAETRGIKRMVAGIY